MPRWSWKPRLHYGLIGGAALVVSSMLTYKEIRQLGSSPWITHHPMFQSEHPKPEFEESTQYLKRIRKKYVLRFPQLHSTSHDPHVLLTLATASDPHTSWLGIQALAARHPWTDAEYRVVAGMLDSHTLVSLARVPSADPRLFLPQPDLPDKTVPLEEELRELLDKLPREHIDMCTLYFTALALEPPKHTEKSDTLHMWTFDGNDVLMDREVNPEQRSLRVYLLALQVLLGYSKVSDYCTDIVSLGGLSSLQHLMAIQAQHKLIQLRVARIVANLTTQPEVHDLIIQAGWVSVLHMWLNSADLALSSLASKALANLDRADKMIAGNIRYMDGVHIYYPQFRRSDTVEADIIFVHGLLGGPFRTWRQQDPPKKPKPPKFKPPIKTPPQDEEAKDNKVEPDMTEDVKDGKGKREKKTEQGKREEEDKVGSHWADPDEEEEEDDAEDEEEAVAISELMESEDEWRTEIKSVEPYTFCWPKDWLAKEIPHARILTVEYETQLSEWAPTCPYDSDKRSQKARAREMLEKLKTAGVGDRPIIWVGHSMGGLLIKQMLCMAAKEPEHEDIVKQSEGLVFYSVPHRGSPLTAYSAPFFPSVEVQELKQDGPELLILSREFEELMLDRSIPLLSFSEGQKTNLPLNVKLLMVPCESSDPGFGTHYLMDERTHLNICKPASRASSVYRLTKCFISECIAAATAAAAAEAVVNEHNAPPPTYLLF